MAWHTVTPKGLNLRAGPGAQHPVVAVLPRTEPVEALGAASPGWLHVQTLGGAGGWVAARYLEQHPAPWLAVAQREEESGVVEIAGDGNNRRILEYHSATLLKATSDLTPWCSSFACWTMERGGYRSTRSAAARSWLRWGTPSAAKLGAVAVFQRGLNPNAGHVAYYIASDGPRILVLGGNQNNRVCRTWYKAAALLGYRWPRQADEIVPPLSQTPTDRAA
jgi:uncharacterized protein (TIGR02594 family)